MNESVENEIAQLREIVGSDRDPDGRAFAPLADALRQAGRLAEAREVLSEGLARHPSFVTGHLVAGRVYRDQGASELAEEAFRRVLELDEENVIALHGLGRMLVVRGRSQEAGALLTRAAELGYTTDLEHEKAVTFEESAGVGSGDGFLEGDAHDEGALAPPVTAAGPEYLEAPDAPDVSDMDDLREDIAPLRAVPHGSVPDGVELETPIDTQPDPDAGPRTRTMAELYVRQGMPDRAIGVYEHLARNDPENEELAARLAELRSRVADGGDSDSLATARRPEAPEADGPVADPLEEAARDVAESGHSSPVESSFTWAQGEGEEPGEAPERDVVEIGALAPDAAVDAPVEISALAPDPSTEAAESTESDAVDIGALAPVEGFVPTMDMDELAPDMPAGSEGIDVVDVGVLAPDEVEYGEAEDGPVVEIDALAPDEPGEREVVPIGALAPEEEALDIGFLAPDDPSGEPY